MDIALNFNDYTEYLEHIRETHLPSNNSNVDFISLSPRSEIEPSKFDQTLLQPVQAQLQSISELKALTQEGVKHIGHLYAYRSLVKAIPVNDGTMEEQDKKDLNLKTFSFLKKEMVKITSLMNYVDKAIHTFSEHFKKIPTTSSLDLKQEFPTSHLSTEYYISLAFFLDKLIQIDLLLEVRSSLKNDFSFYKRSLSLNKEEIPDHAELTSEVTQIGLFLFNHQYSRHSILFKIRASLNTPEFAQIIDKIIFQFVSILDSKLLLNPDQKFSILRSLLSFIFLGENPGLKLSFFKNKGYESHTILKKLARINSVIPLLGEMIFTVETLIQLCESFEEKTEDTWKLIKSPKDITPESSLNLKNLSNLIFEEHNYQASSINALIKNHSLKEEIKHHHFLEAIRFLNDTMTKFKHVISLKYAFPSTEVSNKKSAVFEMYQKVIAFNFNDEEKSALIKIIYCVRTLSSLIKKAWAHCGVAILNSFFKSIRFSLEGLIPVYKKKASKTKYTLLKTVLAEIIKTQYLEDNYKDNHKTASPFNLKPLLILTEILTKSNEETGGFLSSKFLKAKDLDLFLNITELSYNLQFIYNLNSNLDITTNFSLLWLREYYLDLSKQLEFPIETSLPWLLIEYILKTRKPVSFINHILSIYNDVCEVTLKVFKKKFLINECRAECGLVCERFSSDVSLSIYKYYKEIGLELLAYRYTPLVKTARAKKDFTVIDGFPLRTKQDINLTWLIGYNSVVTLDVDVDLRKSVINHLNNHFRVNLEIILNNFEMCKNKQSLLEFNYNYKAINYAHAEISKLLSIDCFNVIYDEINQKTELKSGSRFLDIFINDFLQNVIDSFGYNSATERFVVALGGRLSSSVSASSKRKSVTNPSAKKPKSIYFFGKYSHIFNRIIKELCGFVGCESLEICFDIVPAISYKLMKEQLLLQLEESVDELHIFIEQLLKGSPSIRLPQLNYGYSALYGYFEIALKFIKDHSELSHAVFQRMRVIGNLISLIRLLTNYKDSENVFKIQEKSLMDGGHAHSLYISAISNLFNIKEEIDAEQLMDLCKKMDSYIKQEEGTDSNFMREAVNHIHRKLEKEGKLSLWTGKIGIEDNLEFLEKRKDIARFVSIIFFTFCENGKNTKQNRTATYGDGVFICCAFLLVVSNSAEKWKYHDFSKFLINLDDDLNPEEIMERTHETPSSTDSNNELMRIVKKYRGMKKENYLLKEVEINNATERDMENKLRGFLTFAKSGMVIVDEAIDNIVNAMSEVSK